MQTLSQVLRDLKIRDQLPVFKPTVQERRQRNKEPEVPMVRPIMLRTLGDQPDGGRRGVVEEMMTKEGFLEEVTPIWTLKNIKELAKVFKTGAAAWTKVQEQEGKYTVGCSTYTDRGDRGTEGTEGGDTIGEQGAGQVMTLAAVIIAPVVSPSSLVHGSISALRGIYAWVSLQPRSPSENLCGHGHSSLQWRLSRSSSHFPKHVHTHACMHTEVPNKSLFNVYSNSPTLLLRCGGLE